MLSCMHSSFGRYGHLDPGEEPVAEELEEMRRLQQPDNEIPAPIPVVLTLARTEDLAVAVVGLAAYTTGVSFDVVIHLRPAPGSEPDLELHDVVGGGWGRRGAASQQLLLGVEYPDGRTASNVHGSWPHGPYEHDDPPELVLHEGGGGGDQFSWSQSYWLAPVPPPGPVTLICAWPAMGLAETRHEVDGQLIAEASSRAQVLWPWQPPQMPQFEPPELPETGWFSRLRHRPEN